jgi:hypothetical protein
VGTESKPEPKLPYHEQLYESAAELRQKRYDPWNEWNESSDSSVALHSLAIVATKWDTKPLAEKLHA